jgi:polyisoprenoid-binding protein YceI
MFADLVLRPASAVTAQQPHPIPDGRVAKGTLSFDGRATAGDFSGTTDSVTGQLIGAADLSGVRGWVVAPVQSIKTGNGKRDKDLNKSMESAKYPAIRFNLVRIAPAGGAGDTVQVVLHGGLVLHGVTRDVELPATIWFRGNTARLRTDFPLDLKDYRIGGLSKLLGMLKMNEKIEVHTDLLFRLGSGK